MATISKARYFVYVLLCEDGTYYTGYSNNPTNRLSRHIKGQGARYTRAHKPSGIVYMQALKTRGAAMKRERQIKSLTHAQKSDLIQSWSSISSKNIRPDVHSVELHAHSNSEWRLRSAEGNQ